jgi:hypothetical protein
MKKIVSSIFLVFVCLNTYSQTVDPLDKFIGTWRWVNGNDTMVIFLKKETMVEVHNIVVLKGYNKYIKNGVVQQSTFPSNFNSNNSFNDTYFNLTNRDDSNLNKVSGIIGDYQNNKSVSLTLNYISATAINFIVTPMSGFHVNGIPGPIKLPSDIILIKQ